MTNPIGIPSGWEEVAAWSLSYSVLSVDAVDVFNMFTDREFHYMCCVFDWLLSPEDVA